MGLGRFEGLATRLSSIWRVWPSWANSARSAEYGYLRHGLGGHALALGDALLGKGGRFVLHR